MEEVIQDLEGKNRKNAKLGPLAEEYVAKIAPKSKIGGPQAFKMPMKMPTHMEYYEEDALAETLKEMIEIDKDIEDRKNRLALKHDFNLTDPSALRLVHPLDQVRDFNIRAEPHQATVVAHHVQHHTQC